MAEPRTPTKKKSATTRASVKRIGASLVDKAAEKLGEVAAGRALTRAKV